MQVRPVITLLCCAVLLQSCSQQSAPESKPDKAGIGSLKLEQNTKIDPKDGLYELAEVIAWAMPLAAKNKPTALPSYQDYNRFKGVVSDITVSKPGWGRYEGGVAVAVNGKPALAENIEDDYKWKVFIDGPEVGANQITFSSQRPVAADMGPTYLRARNFEIVNLSCFSDGDTPTDATALYLARYPGKDPTLLTYTLSTGSRGTTIDYHVHFGGLQWDAVPGARVVNYKGEVQGFASCRYKELR